MTENSNGAQTVDSVPRGLRSSEDGDGSEDMLTDGDEDGSVMESEAAYSKFEEKWMDCLGYSKPNFTEGSEDSEGDDEGEGEYCSDDDDDGEEDDDAFASGTVDVEEDGLQTIDADMSIRES